MKKNLAPLLLLAFALPFYAHSAAKTVSVKEAKTLHDDAHVILKGKITGRAGDDDHYWLEDSTGKIRIDVEDDDWEDSGAAIGKTVRVVGDVDKNDGHTEIEVDHISVVH
ncbi:NirD/YgiW/YdeI family stress tolerance protein [Kalamiella sp. sgz302252]|uniref:NirD/YgiW/YdeI family stress tolerance protein n=1 Tax=Pantoea sp. sgz302252 TaxID=3341827 RepID=UPI0036D30543